MTISGSTDGKKELAIALLLALLLAMSIFGFTEIMSAWSSRAIENSLDHPSKVLNNDDDRTRYVWRAIESGNRLRLEQLMHEAKAVDLSDDDGQLWSANMSHFKFDSYRLFREAHYATVLAFNMLNPRYCHLPYEAILAARLREIKDWHVETAYLKRLRVRIARSNAELYACPR
jgi:hypothetical protein